MSKIFSTGTLRSWLPLAFVLTVACGLVYVSVQQDLRQGANDPQIQLAEDASAALEAKLATETLRDWSEVLPAGPQADIARSLSPYMIVFVGSTPSASNAVLNGKTPIPPEGVLAYAEAHGEDRITWEPQPGVRSAIVVKYFHGNTQPIFVLAGRSLREVEKREEKLTMQVGALWFGGLITTLLLVAGLERGKLKPSKEEHA